MAKCRGPLFSENASGKFKCGITFSLRESGQQVRLQKAQTDILTTARSVVRDSYKTTATAWSALSESAKNEYKERAGGKPYTGYNLFMRENIAVGACGIYGIRIYAVGLYGSLV